MLIVFCVLCLTYFPWPGTGAIWTRSTKRDYDTDELRELAASGDACKPTDRRGRLAFSATDAFLSRLCSAVVQGELENIFPDYGRCSFSIPALVTRGR